MKLRDFFQGDVRIGTEGGIQELMRAILVRAQFVPGVRHALGWRGLKQSVAAEAEGWTARIAGYDGVFGLCFTGIEDAPGWVVGAFGLSYFPGADEELVERCSLRAAAFSQRPDYIPLVREFLHHEEMSSLFRIGTLFLALDVRQQALYLGMESQSALRSIAQAGVRLPRDGRMVQVIEPGGQDQNLPALSLTRAFFDVLAASLVFHLDQVPGRLFERRSPGTEIVYDHAGAIQKIPAADIEDVLVGLGYGEGRFVELFDALAGPHRAPGRELQWREGETIPPVYERMRWWNARHTSDYKTFDKKSLGIDVRPPLTILSGFLGAGKTSFLQHFIEYQTQRSRFVAVIQNEIGDVGLDGKLLDYTVTEIDEGCVCCSLVGNLKRAVNDILSSFQPDFIILETTGAANPLNLLDEIGELKGLVRYDCTVTVVDALNLDSTLSRFAIAADQIRSADVLLLNKCDLVSEACLQKANKRLQDINPKAVVFMTTRGNLNPALIFDMGDQWDEKNVLPLTAGSKSPVHSSHAHDGLRCKTLVIPKPLDRKEFLSAIESLPPAVFRVKGIIEFTDSSQPMLFQYVAGRFELSLFPQPAVTDRFLTIVAQGESPDLVGNVWKAWKTDMAID
jgi:G3E family GTPase